MRRGTKVAQAYIEASVDGSGINEDIVDAVEGAEPGVEKAGDEAGEKYANRFSDRFREKFDSMREKAADKFTERFRDAGREGGEQAGKSMVQGLTKHLDDDFANQLGERFSEQFIDALERRMGGTQARRPLSDLFDRLMADANDGGIGGGGGRGGRGSSLGDRTGSLLGAGSRSNTLNLLGRSIGNVINLTEKAGKAIKPLFSAFTKGFTEAGEGASFLQKTMGGLSKTGAEAGAMGSRAFAAIAASGPGAAVAAAVVVVAMSALVSVMGAVLALAVALAATIGSALVGALTVGAGALLAVVAAGGLLTAAFMSMTDAQKGLLKDAFIPLREEMVGLGQIMIQDMVPAFGVWSQNLQKALSLALPVARVMGEAFAKAGTTLTAAFSGPGFQALSQNLAVYLPSIVQRLSAALGSFLNGVAGTFSALLPFVNRFAGYLANVADRFSRWANSASGQNAIVDFTERALTSLKSLWGFVKQFSGLIADVLFSPVSQAAGNSVFDSLARSFEGFRQKFAAAAADGSLQRWFEDAIQFGGRFFDLMGAIGGVIAKLYSSGVLDALGNAFGVLSTYFDAMGTILGPLIDILGFALPIGLAAATLAFQAFAAAIITTGEVVEWVGGLLNKVVPGNPFGDGAEWNQAAKAWNQVGQTAQSAIGMAGTAAALANAAQGAVSGIRMGGAVGLQNQRKSKGYDTTNLLNLGRQSIAATSSGKQKAQYNNPYTKWANSLIDDGPSMVAQVRKALQDMVKEMTKAINDAAKAPSLEQARNSLFSSYENLINGAQSTVDSARQNLNSAASSLASASSKSAAKKALKEVMDAQAALQIALKDQKRINVEAKEVNAQRKVDWNRVWDLMAGRATTGNATLAEYAAARERVAVKIDDANQKLADAIAMRDDYKNQIADGIKSFAALTTASAQTLNGVEQALTVGDITTNLQARLDKIRKFNDNLRILLAQGLSNDAYKQILDAGVEGGSSYAEALVQGGAGAIGQVNSLTSQINSIANQVGGAASSQLYDAGVQAAKGLVDGLTSLSKQLDSAATQLGNSIALSIKRSLGIKSPSRVMIATMGYVGDGIEQGLDAQRNRVGAAAGRLSNSIAVSPEVAAYASKQGQPATVSGNQDGRFRDLIVNTPTEDPKAVAHEVLNEVTGRLP